ncbi:SRPBCC domain-containing protein [Pedobacter sp. JY14-1]|uniref:SRPBCC domain-containing protein n=1 Tax=Pedobacter sp. JY14-1 TaxID=3034151 RepID=UPI0023E2D172|nr:SRPBCC domain-containing protein [Pedobacter sp. JY14-1]
MNKAILFDFTVDKANRKINVDRSFNAPLELVWAAWTDASILDLWWAPKPWKTETKSMDFREGGRWHYSMVGPEGERHWCLFDYEQIEPEKRYSGMDSFCDENQVMNSEMPRMRWNNKFSAQDADSAVVNVEISFEKLEDLEKIIEMGFREGFTMGLGNLDEYISAQFYLRRQKKPNGQPRVSSYVNFAGNTEEAMEFYKSVFQTEYVNGIQRFGEIPAEPGQPPIGDALKNMVLHVELPLLGGHVLMATDAPKEMGFTVTPGNNMHINLEPASREEADRIFNSLSAGGKVSMPLQDMFWGAYFGSFTDKYGINWMINYQPPANPGQTEKAM